MIDSHKISPGIRLSKSLMPRYNVIFGLTSVQNKHQPFVVAAALPFYMYYHCLKATIATVKQLQAMLWEQVKFTSVPVNGAI